MPALQTVKLTGCGRGRLHWHIPRRARQLEVRFQESDSTPRSFSICVQHHQSSLNGLLQVSHQLTNGAVPYQFSAGPDNEVCVQSGQDKNFVVLRFKLAKDSDAADASFNDVNYPELNNMYEIVIDVRRL